MPHDAFTAIHLQATRALARETTTCKRCERCGGRGERLDRSGYCSANPTGFDACPDCGGHGEIERSPYDADLAAARAAWAKIPAAARPAARAEAQHRLTGFDALARTLYSLRTTPIPPTAHDAAAVLGADLTGACGPCEAAARIALAASDAANATGAVVHGHLRGLVFGLLNGDLARAEEAALAVARPATARAAALDHLRARAAAEVAS